MRQLAPYVRFNDGKCKEAMTFYHECLGGELKLDTIGDSPMAKDMPAEKQGYIMHAALKNGSIEFFASDMMMDKAVVGDNMAICINCESDEEIESLFAKLAAGGSVFMPLEVAFWGDKFGVLTDKYGIEWMFNYHK